MKYILIVFGALIIARIDILIHGLESIFKKIDQKTEVASTEVESVSPSQPQDMVSIKEDKTLKFTPRLQFFTFLEDFRLNPSLSSRSQIKNLLQKNPTLFNETLDKELEANILKMVELVFSKNNELAFLLVDLMELLKGENLDMVQKFFTIILDKNIDLFMTTYSKTKDKNCISAKYLGLKVEEEEIINELSDRKTILEEFVQREKIDPIQLQLAQNCLLVLNLEIDRINALESSSTNVTSDTASEPQQIIVEESKVQSTQTDQMKSEQTNAQEKIPTAPITPAPINTPSTESKPL